MEMRISGEKIDSAEDLKRMLLKYVQKASFSH
jgi:hypothetical protein